MIDPSLALRMAALIALLLGALFWPRRGLVSRWRRTRRMTRRVLREDALKHIYSLELDGRQASTASIAGTLAISMNEAAALLAGMAEDGLVRSEQNEITLTETGSEAALHIIRAHRLWERYLAEETGFDEQVWHERAEQWEHTLSPDEVDDLSAQLGYPAYDPHGDPIPTASGDFRGHGGEPLTELAKGSVARIVHLEDEPEIVYAQLLAEGLYLGQVLRITENSTERIRFRTNGNEHLLAPIVAANISVSPLERQAETVSEMAAGYRMSALRPGQTAEVVSISAASRGAERRRLLDLGLMPGTQVTAEFDSPSGDPVAYRIRGAVIALREDQARHVRVREVSSD